MLSNQPLISVIIPTHNRLSFLKRAIASVEEQTWAEIELIVVDDASNDDTAKYLRTLQPAVKKFHFCINEKSVGGAGARNIGIKESTGKFVAFLDDDDVWYKDKISRQFALFTQTPGCVAISCSYVHFSSFGHKKQINISLPNNLQDLLCYNTLGGTSLLFTSKSMLDQLGGFDELLRSSQDWDLWIRLYQTGKIVAINEPLARYESHIGFRISTNMLSVYNGRRALYHKYKSLMTEHTRKINIAAILFARIHKEASTNVYLLKRTLFLFRLGGCKIGLKYFFWTCIIIGKKKRSGR